MSPLRFLRGVVPVFFLMLSVSCVGTRSAKVIDIAPSQSPQLMIARESRGVDIQWKSIKNQRYRLLYRDGQNKKAPWNPLPVAANVMGTGGMLTVRDQSTGAFQRSYMLEIIPEDTLPSRRR